MANAVPPIPYKTPVLKRDNKFSDPWKKFLRELWNRSGANAELPSSGADVVTNANNITDLRLRIEAIEQEPVS